MVLIEDKPVTNHVTKFYRPYYLVELRFVDTSEWLSGLCVQHRVRSGVESLCSLTGGGWPCCGDRFVRCANVESLLYT